MDRKAHVIAAKIYKAEDDAKTRNWEQALVGRFLRGEYLSKIDTKEAKKIMKRDGVEA